MTAVHSDDRPVLGSIVGDTDHFLRCVLGQGPWRGHVACADRVFGIDDVDRIVASAVRVPAIRMVRNGERIPPERFCAATRIGSSTLHDVADARKVLDEFRRGATVVLQSLHRTWSPLSGWSAALEREIGWPVQANAYLTPAGESGLAPHSDGHDVMAIQLHGTKGWDVDGWGTVGLDVGDVLYLPAGVTHRARSEGQPSLHLTIGIHRPIPDRIARTAATIASAALPIETAPEAVVWLLQDVFRDVDASEVVERLRRRPRNDATGLLASSIARGTVTDHTWIASVGDWSIETCDDRISLTWSDGELWFPERAEAALALLADHDGARQVSRLPGLEPDERVILARRLVDEGAATLNPRPQPGAQDASRRGGEESRQLLATPTG